VPLTRADAVRADFSALRITRYPHTLLLDRMWELRENLTAYDATFVALAEVLDAPLVTTDARLAAAPGHRAAIEVY
jgi:predicted nucleic acid-binding protein